MPMSQIRSLLVPTDFSPGAQAALRFAVALARPLGASITVLHVYQLPNYILPDGTAILADAPTVARIDTEVAAALDGLRAQLADEGVAIRTEAVAGGTVDEIIRVARDGGHDLIVMGTHGYTGLKHLVLGSVAERVVRLAPCPVLTVREHLARRMQ
jgi:nucleotide-binding universal stress UspA family protein